MLGSLTTTLPPPAEKIMTSKKTEQLRRMRVAAYLYQLAEAVREGEVRSFDARWEPSMEDIQIDLVPVFGVNSDR